MPEIILSGNFRTFGRRLQKARADFRNCVDKAMRTAVETGVDGGRRNIETRGTGKTWSRPWGPNGRTSSSPGRVDTGQMRDDFRGNLNYGSNSVEGKFGWTDEQKDYYLYQEEGFYHWLTGEQVEEMRALADAKDVAWEVLIAGCEDCMKKFVKGV